VQAWSNRHALTTLATVSLAMHVPGRVSCSVVWGLVNTVSCCEAAGLLQKPGIRALGVCSTASGQQHLLVRNYSWQAPETAWGTLSEAPSVRPSVCLRAHFAQSPVRALTDADVRHHLSTQPSRESIKMRAAGAVTKLA
jgi:hypothetical protein